MRAIRFHAFGPPAAQLTLETMPEPEPGPGQVRVRLTHRPINPSDLLTVSGHYGRLPTLPATPGMEGMGRIDALGEGVAGWAIGQRVIPLGLHGTWREAAVHDAARLLPVPDAVSDEAAAQFVANPVSAWVMMFDLLNLQAGDWLLQSAAGSTLGRLVIQLAALKGIRTINLVRRRAQVEEILALGAEAVICTADEDIVSRVSEITGRQGATAAIDAVGGQTCALAVEALEPGGTLICYGVLSMKPAPIQTGNMLFRGTTMRGFWLSSWFQRSDPGHVSDVLQELMGLMATGALVPPVEALYDLADVHAAVTRAEQPGRRGKILLVG